MLTVRRLKITSMSNKKVLSQIICGFQRTMVTKKSSVEGYLVAWKNMDEGEEGHQT